MGLFNKLKFWKKKEPDFDFDKDLGLDFDSSPGESSSGMPDFSQQRSQDFDNPLQQQQQSQSGMSSQQNFPRQGSGLPTQRRAFEEQQPEIEPIRGDDHESKVMAKNLEVISYKLDAIQAILNSMNQRLNNLEDKESTKGKWRY